MASASASSSASSKPNQPIFNCGTGSSLFKRRSKTLKKKAWELASLCDIPVCLISYSPDGNLQTWPENKTDVEAIVMRYKNFEGRDRGNQNPKPSLGPCLDLESKLDPSLGFLESSKKDQNKKRKTTVEDFEKLLTTWEERLYELHEEESLISLSTFVESKSRILKDKIELIKEKETNSSSCISSTSNNSSVLNAFAANFGSKGKNQNGFPVPQEFVPISVRVRCPTNSFWSHDPLPAA